MILNGRKRGIGEQHLLARNLQLGHQSLAGNIVHGLPFGMTVVDQSAAEYAVAFGKGVERTVNLQSGIVRGIDESSHKVEIGTGKSLPLTNLRRIFAGIHHFARSALDVEHQRRHAGLPALVHIITDRIGVTETHPVGRTVEPHQFGFHPLGGTPTAGRTCRGKGQQAYSQQFFHGKLKAIFVCSFRKYRLRPHGKDRPPRRSAARIRAA